MAPDKNMITQLQGDKESHAIGKKREQNLVNNIKSYYAFLHFLLQASL